MAKKFYSVAKLSDRISETPEGFLICQDVAITRVGDLLYAPGETPITLKEGVNYVTVSRTADDIHDPETIASFEGKPVTLNHPDDFVTPDNWRELSVGVVQNVRPGKGEDADKLMADLLITDREAIYAVRSKKLREVSCGYEAEYIEDAPGKGRQKNIIGNHVALVPAGRCGSQCAIFDHAPNLQEKPMKLKDKLLGLFSKALDEAKLDDAPGDDAEAKAKAEAEAAAKAKAGDAAALDARMTKIEELLTKAIDKLDPEAAAAAAAAKAKAADEAKKAEDEAAAAAAAKAKDTEGEADPMAKRLATIEAALAKLLGLEEEEKQQREVGDEMCKDAETIARAEILAPGIAKTADVKTKALDAAYATEDGKAIIDSLLAGKTLETADKDMLFVAASEMLKGTRRSQFQSQVSLDSLPGMKAGEMTPEKINAMNAERYGKK